MDKQTATNNEVSQDDSVDIAAVATAKAETDFWKMKYFEYMLHTQQVIAMLNAPMLQQLRSQQIAARQAKVGK